MGAYRKALELLEPRHLKKEPWIWTGLLLRKRWLPIVFLRNHKEADSENEGRVRPTAATGMTCVGCRCNAGGWGGRTAGG